MSLKVLDNFVPPLLDAVLLDYQRNVPVAREPEVLSTMEVIVNKLEVLHDMFFCFFVVWSQSGLVVAHCCTSGLVSAGIGIPS